MTTFKIMREEPLLDAMEENLDIYKVVLSRRVHRYNQLFTKFLKSSDWGL